jgi:hypothetical protein
MYILSVATSDDLISLIEIVVNILRTINVVYDQEHALLLTMAFFSYSVLTTLCESQEL